MDVKAKVQEPLAGGKSTFWRLAQNKALRHPKEFEFVLKPTGRLWKDFIQLGESDQICIL